MEKCLRGLIIRQVRMSLSSYLNLNISSFRSWIAVLVLCYYVWQTQTADSDCLMCTMSSSSRSNSLSSVLLSYENLIHALSGALGSTVALSIFFPLDTVRTHQQLSTSTGKDHAQSDKSLKVHEAKRKHGINKEWIQIAQEVIAKRGVAGLYSGLGAVNKSICVSNFIYFYSYNALKKLALEQGFTQRPALNLLLGMISGTINVLTTTPLWVANTRIKLQGSKFDKSDSDGKLQKAYYKGLIDCVLKIAKREGIKALWSGTVPSLILVFNPAIQWAVYESLKANLGENSGSKGTFYLFVISAFAKCIASLTTYPLQLLQNRLRAKWLNKDNKELQISMLSYFRNIIRTQGIGGLFHGLEVKLWQTVLTAAFMFVIYEKLNAKILRFVLDKQG
ncbi:peroxisomal membrane protein PMP34-like [Convolutriloba macropyga]|uniref:peroxisomal membrane protein PMP34-like n=1 Tax=Convolutriloba macropyga TaxID=536237 RepID=UPI003F51FCF7